MTVDPLMTHGPKYRQAHTEAAAIFAILNRCYEAGKLPDFESTFGGSRMVPQFDEKKGYAALRPDEKAMLMRYKIPLDYIREHDRNIIECRVRLLCRRAHDNPYRAAMSPLLYRKACNYRIDGAVCGNPLPQNSDGVNGVICDACAAIEDEKEKRDKKNECRMRWLEITPSQFQPPFLLDYPLLSLDARESAAIHANKVDSWKKVKAWTKIGGWLWLGNDESGVKTGVTGSGKSHLSCRAQLAAMMDGLSGYRITAGTWNDATKKNLAFASAQWAEDVKKWCLTVECLLFDEIGEVGIADDVAPVKAFFDLIRERTERGLCTIVNSQGGPDYLMQQFGRWDENKSRVSAMVRRLEENSK